MKHRKVASSRGSVEAPRRALGATEYLCIFVRGTVDAIGLGGFNVAEDVPHQEDPRRFRGCRRCPIDKATF